MKPNASKSWRAECDDEAFDHNAWEFKAQMFCHSAKRMMELVEHEAAVEKPTVDLFMLPFAAEFLISLAIELISKAHYLKTGVGPREQIYTHTLHDLGIDSQLTPEHICLARHSERYVIWAGRYPTPTWTKEKFKEDYDVPSVFENGIEKINGEDIPNTASIPRIKAKIELYSFIRALWESVGKRQDTV
jgi:hypothetical protein